MYIDVKIQEDICFLWLNKPGTNSLSQELLDELYDVICWASKQNTVKVIVLTSKLPFGFSSGLDLGSFMDDQQTVFAEKIYNAVYKSFQITKIIIQSHKIFIAALSGPVIGSAASIAFSCDFRFAARGTWFWLPDVQYGGLLVDGGIEILKRLVGNSRSYMLGLTNDRINLDEADKWGLIYKVAERQKLEEAAFSFAKKLCGFSFNTLSSHKKIINEGLLNDFREEQLREILSSEDTYKKFLSHMRNKKKCKISGSPVNKSQAFYQENFSR